MQASLELHCKRSRLGDTRKSGSSMSPTAATTKITTINRPKNKNQARFQASIVEAMASLV